MIIDKLLRPEYRDTGCMMGQNIIIIIIATFQFSHVGTNT
jgi:hypothetical protein